MLEHAANLDDARTNRPKSLSPRRRQPSLKMFPDDFLDLTETILYLNNCTKNVKRPRVPSKMFFRFVILGNTRRKKAIFSHLNVCFFPSKNSVFDNLSGLWELTFYLHQICLITLLSVIKMLWTSAKLGITRKKLKVFFSLER